MWYYGDKEFTSDMICDYVGYVYCITDKTNNKKYIGKKNFWSTRRLKPLKGQKRKRIKKMESDWMNYYGSNEEVKLLLEESGPDRFHREILRLCKTKGDMSYYEMKEQIDREVLFSEEYYNEFIGGKIHSRHLSKK